MSSLHHPQAQICFSILCRHHVSHTRVVVQRKIEESRAKRNLKGVKPRDQQQPKKGKDSGNKRKGVDAAEARAEAAEQVQADAGIEDTGDIQLSMLKVSLKT